jgi:hypothetical protein
VIDGGCVEDGEFAGVELAPGVVAGSSCLRLVARVDGIEAEALAGLDGDRRARTASLVAR